MSQQSEANLLKASPLYKGHYFVAHSLDFSIVCYSVFPLAPYVCTVCKYYMYVPYIL